MNRRPAALSDGAAWGHGQPALPLAPAAVPSRQVTLPRALLCCEYAAEQLCCEYAAEQLCCECAAEQVCCECAAEQSAAEGNPWAEEMSESARTPNAQVPSVT